MPPTPTRYIREVGATAWRQIYGEGDCAASPRGYHFARSEVLPARLLAFFDAVAVVHGTDVFGDNGWPLKCDACPFVFTPEAHRSVSPVRLYDTPSGEPQPGDVFWVPCPSSPEVKGCYPWDNCPGRHLHAIVPSGEDWDIDGRGGNCCKPDERTHRCWTRHGDPEADIATFFVDNLGNCGAGGGSIQTKNYHGHLRAGRFEP